MCTYVQACTCTDRHVTYYWYWYFIFNWNHARWFSQQASQVVRTLSLYRYVLEPGTLASFYEDYLRPKISIARSFFNELFKALYVKKPLEIILDFCSSEPWLLFDKDYLSPEIFFKSSFLATYFTVSIMRWITVENIFHNL